MLLKILGMKNKNIRFFKKKKWGMKWKEDKKNSSNKSISSWQESLSCSDDKQYILDGRINICYMNINILITYFDWFINL